MCLSLVSGVSESAIMEEHGAGYIMNRKKIIEMADVIGQEVNKRKLKSQMEATTLKTWQTEVVKMLEEQDDRVILFVWIQWEEKEKPT